MLDGHRRFAIVFAAASLLAPLGKATAGTIPKDGPQIVITENSSARAADAGSTDAVSITPQARADAADIFESRCVACHGAEGHGDGPAASNLNPKPIDFHNRDWQKSIDDATIARAIVEGGSAVGVSGEMAANPDLADQPAVVAALVVHVRELGR
jgi:mono/diheme cytochrome c family protein